MKYNDYQNIAYCQLHATPISSQMMKAHRCIDPGKHGARGCCKHFKKNRDSAYWYRLGKEA